MNTKRVNKEYHRLDIKLPKNLYEQVSEIAVNSFDAKVHHISNKPEITPTLLYLLELGIEAFSNGNELTKKPNTDNYTDTIPITRQEVQEMIDNAIFCHKLDFHTGIDTDNITDNITDKMDIAVEDLTDNNTDTIPITDISENSNEDNELDIRQDKENINYTDNDTDNDTDKIKSFEVAKEEIKRLFGEGKNYSQIAAFLKGKYLTVSQKNTNWRGSQVERVLRDLGLLPDNKGNDKTF